MALQTTMKLGGLFGTKALKVRSSPCMMHCARSRLVAEVPSMWHRASRWCTYPCGGYPCRSEGEDREENPRLSPSPVAAPVQHRACAYASFILYHQLTHARSPNCGTYPCIDEKKAPNGTQASIPPPPTQIAPYTIQTFHTRTSTL